MILPPIDAGPPTLGLVDHDGVITARRRTKGSCFNHAYIVNEDERTVVCKKCERSFDPYAALMDLALHIDRYRDARKHAEDTAKQAHEHLDDLLRRIKNARSTLRRTGAEVPPPKYFHT